MCKGKLYSTALQGSLQVLQQASQPETSFRFCTRKVESCCCWESLIGCEQHCCAVKLHFVVKPQAFPYSMTSRGTILGQATFAWPFHMRKQTLVTAGQTLVSASNTAGLSTCISLRRLSLLFTAKLRTDFAFEALCMHDLVVTTTQRNRSHVTFSAD